MPINVFKSDDINKFDTCNDCIYLLDDVNNIKDDLILLYIYSLPKYPLHGYKVGMTKCKYNETFWHAIHDRIRNQTNELCLDENEYELFGKDRKVEFWGICINDKYDDFQDHRIHQEIKNKIPGLVEKDHEWFYSQNLNIVYLRDIFKEYRDSGEPAYEIYKPRWKQPDAIQSLKDYFSLRPKRSKFLLNCKMRFGKCYTIYKYAEETDKKKILILTFVPAVEHEWMDNLKHIETKFMYITDDDLKNPDFALEDNPAEPYVVFLSLQNYLGKDRDTKSTKEKIEKLQGVNFDVLVLDEYHFGAWNKNTQETIEGFDEEYVQRLRRQKEPFDFEKQFQIHVDETICLSGTPFKALDRGEFSEENTYSYSYFEEQKNKYPNADNDDFETIDPEYAEFPDMEIYGYNIANLFGGETYDLMKEDKTIGRKSIFSLNKFLLTKKDNDPNEECEFIYEDQIKVFLQTLCGSRREENYIFPYEYTNIDYVRNSLWLLPTVNSCIAMTKLLNEDRFFRNFQIINISDPSVGNGPDALAYLKREMLTGEQKGKQGSITITVNKLTLGVTVKEWSSVLVLKDLSSPEQYFQAIFRIQTPLLDEQKRPIKKKCKVYDFNIDRASALLLKYSEETNSYNITKLQIAQLIVKYMPIYLNGDVNKRIGVDVFFDLARLGDSSGKSLSQKITDISRTTYLDDQTKADIVNDPAASEVLKKVFAHTTFRGKKKGRTPISEGISFHKTEEYKKGLGIGYEEGNRRINEFLELDEAQKELDRSIENLYIETVPAEYNAEQKSWFHDGVGNGFYNGINVPIKKLKIGEEDGKNFVTIIKKTFGENIQYNNETRPRIKSFINEYLNDENNIPVDYRGEIYRTWYSKSFQNAAIKELRPPLDDGEIANEDVDNALRHLLARLFQFLYISVYRETTFAEIFKNADPNVFLSAVGITKDDFQLLNQYHVFKEKLLDEYVNEFFVNETLGKNLTDEEREEKNYRNSFNWFGFGVEN